MHVGEKINVLFSWIFFRKREKIDSYIGIWNDRHFSKLVQRLAIL